MIFLRKCRILAPYLKQNVVCRIVDSGHKGTKGAYLLFLRPTTPNDDLSFDENETSNYADNKIGQSSVEL